MNDHHYIKRILGSRYAIYGDVILGENFWKQLFKMKLFNYKRSGAFVYFNTENALHKQVQMLILPILWLVIMERFVLTLVFISKLRFLHVLKKLQLRNLNSFLRILSLWELSIFWVAIPSMIQEDYSFLPRRGIGRALTQISSSK